MRRVVGLHSPKTGVTHYPRQQQRSCNKKVAIAGMIVLWELLKWMTICCNCCYQLFSWNIKNVYIRYKQLLNQIYINLFLAKCASVLNPIVFALSHPKYREALATEIPCLGLGEFIIDKVIMPHANQLRMLFQPKMINFNTKFIVFCIFFVVLLLD